MQRDENNQPLSIKDVADFFGLTYEEMIIALYNEGLIDKHARPTEKAIREGLMIESPKLPEFEFERVK